MSPTVLTGHLRKMQTRPVANDDGSYAVHYNLRLGDDEGIALNPLLGKQVELRFSGQIACVHCGRKIKKSYSQGFCFPCAQQLPSNDLCQVRPEICHFTKGTCRDPAWGQAHCMITHTVYLANSSGLKVGITRTHQQVMRWMDQGAVTALPLLSVNNRRDAGLIEHSLRQHVSDRTNWRVMLKGDQPELDLQAKRQELLALLTDAVPYQPAATPVHQFIYPILAHPDAVRAHNLDKEPSLSGRLMGIKGQYLIFDNMRVLNVRKYAGYEVTFATGTAGMELVDKELVGKELAGKGLAPPGISPGAPVG